VTSFFKEKKRKKNFFLAKTASKEIAENWFLDFEDVSLAPDHFVNLTFC
jgi:hypothetical protein